MWRIIRNASRQQRFLVVAILAAIAFRLIALAVPIDPMRAPDSHSFVALANSFSQTGELSYEDQGVPGVPLRAFRSLLYPIFLSVAGGGHGRFLPALILQGLLGVAVVLCAFVVSRRAFGPAAAMVTASIGAVYWTSVYFERQLLTESLYTFFLMLGLALIVDAFARSDGGRKSVYLALAGGISLGLGSLTRPVGLAVLGAVFLLWILRLALAAPARPGSARIVRTLLLPCCFLLAASIVVAPAVYRNTRVLKAPVMLTSGGMNFWAGNGRGTISDAWDIMRTSLPAYGEVEMDRWFYRDVAQHRQQILRELPRLLVKKVWTFFAPATREAQYLPFRFLLPFALLGGLTMLHRIRWPALLILTVTLSQILIALAFVPIPRYRAPIDPLLYTFAAVGLVWLWRKSVAGRWLVFGLLGANLAALLVL